MKHYRIIAIVLAAALVFTTGGCDLVNVNIAESKATAADSLSESNSEGAVEDTESEINETSESEEAPASEEEPESEEAADGESESESEAEEDSDDSSDESEEESAIESEEFGNDNSSEPAEANAPATPSVPETQPTAALQPTQPAVTPQATSVNGNELVNYLMQFVGKTPYLWGGEDLVNGADCSGTIVAAYRHFGVSLPHYSGSLTDQGSYRRVSPDEIMPGDIIGCTGAVETFIGYMYEDAQRAAFRPSNEGLFIKLSDLIDVAPREGVIYETQVLGGEWVEYEINRDLFVMLFSEIGYVPIVQLQRYCESWTMVSGHENDRYENYMETYTIRRGFCIGYTSETPGAKLRFIECGEVWGYRPVTNTAASQDAPDLFH